MNTIRTLSECIGLLSIDGFNTKAEVRAKLVALREELLKAPMPTETKELLWHYIHAQGKKEKLLELYRERKLFVPCYPGIDFRWDKLNEMDNQIKELESELK